MTRLLFPGEYSGYLATSELSFGVFVTENTLDKSNVSSVRLMLALQLWQVGLGRYFLPPRLILRITNTFKRFSKLSNSSLLLGARGQPDCPAPVAVSASSVFITQFSLC